MPKSYPCPCCLGAGVRHRPDAESDADCVEECAHCAARGTVTRAERAEILRWLEKCRSRSRSLTPSRHSNLPPRATNADC